MKDMVLKIVEVLAPMLLNDLFIILEERRAPRHIAKIYGNTIMIINSVLVDKANKCKGCYKSKKRKKYKSGRYPGLKSRHRTKRSSRCLNP